MGELNDYSGTAGSNNAESPNGWKEGILAGALNNSDREFAARVKRWYADNNGSLATGGTSTAITVTLNAQHSAWFDGLSFWSRVTTTCGATPTINPTGSGALGAKSLYWPDGTQLAASDIVAGGVYGFYYELTSDKVYVIGAKPDLAAASETVAGKVELATQAEVNTGTDTARAITPAGLTGWTPGVGTVTAVSTDKVLLADASASGVLKQALISDITALVPASLTAGTADTTLSGTTGASFTSLPAGIKRITIMFRDLSLDDTDDFLIQLGTSGGLVTTGYASAARNDGAAHGTSTAGFIMGNDGAAETHTGHMILTKLTDNIWVSSHAYTASAGNGFSVGSGSVDLGAELDRVALVDTGGDNFDGGSVNIMYEV